MTLFGLDRAVSAFGDAMRSGALHHAWLLGGPQGVGKASFARIAATRLLADAAGPKVELPGLDVPEGHRIAHLIRAGSHPDFRWLKRELNDKGDALRRNITVKQVRKLGELFAVQPALSDWRAVVIDSVDELEPSAANALLKMLEEPPGRSVFFLVSHSPGRLLPTIRSRCRRLAFEPLDDDAMASALAIARPEMPTADLRRLLAVAGGSVGRALNFAELDMAPIEQLARDILRTGDRDNQQRSKLSAMLALKAAAPRYAAFLELVPPMIANEARRGDGRRQQAALAAYERARETVAVAPRMSLDPAATVFQLGSILASIAT